MKNSLRNFLLNKRLELYEKVCDLKDRKLVSTFTERDSTALEVAEAELNLVKEIITICNNRNKF